MEKTVHQLFSPLVLPAALVGFSSNAFQKWFPELSTWIGWISLVALSIATLMGVIGLATHRLVPRRFANLIYVIDKAGNLAVVDHPYHKRVQPPGSRLGYHEAPHAAIPRVLKEELGLDASRVEVLPRPAGRHWGDVELVPPPVQVQVERHTQRLGVREHYDFVYVGTINDVKPVLNSPLNPRWLSLAELKSLATRDVTRAPFSDVIPTFEMILRRADVVAGPESPGSIAIARSDALRTGDAAA